MTYFFSDVWLQVDPDVFAALPKELQEELKSAYNRAANYQPQTKMRKTLKCSTSICSAMLLLSPPPPHLLSFSHSYFPTVEQKNALLQLKQSVGVGVGRVKRRYKRKNTVSPAKKGPSPQKKYRPMNSPAKTAPPFTKLKEPLNVLKVDAQTILLKMQHL